MPKAEQQDGIITSLSQLEDKPAEQYKLALRLLEKERGFRVMTASLAVVREHITHEARSVLHRVFDYLAQAGVKRDPGCYIRTGILDTLLGIANQTDLPLAFAALDTYEFLPPTRMESAGNLRAAGLLLLNHLDEVMAKLAAVRLLVDVHTSRMSGEPAVTAAQVLAGHGEALPLYMYVLDNRGGHRSSETLAQCLRSLSNVPTPVLDALIKQYGETEDDLVLSGLLDLILDHSERAAYQPFLLNLLSTTHRLDIYRYLCASIVAEHKQDLIEALQSLANTERNSQKREILAGALALVNG